MLMAKRLRRKTTKASPHEGREDKRLGGRCSRLETEDNTGVATASPVRNQ